jgi:hypothetical protein
MNTLRAGRRVRLRLDVPAANYTMLRYSKVLLMRDLEIDFEYTGPLPELLRWLSELPVADLKIEPMGLANIYRQYHEQSEPEA